MINYNDIEDDVLFSIAFERMQKRINRIKDFAPETYRMANEEIPEVVRSVWVGSMPIREILRRVFKVSEKQLGSKTTVSLGHTLADSCRQRFRKEPDKSQGLNVYTVDYYPVFKSFLEQHYATQQT